MRYLIRGTSRDNTDESLGIAYSYGGYGHTSILIAAGNYKIGKLSTRHSRYTRICYTDGAITDINDLINRAIILLTDYKNMEVQS